MTIKQIVIAAILGATLGAAASTVHADPVALDGTFVCDAMIWPADKVPFDGAPEGDQVRRYEIFVNNAGMNITAVGGRDMPLTLWAVDGGRPGLFGKNDLSEWAYSSRDDKHQPYFGYRNSESGDSVGFYNCVAKRKF